MTKDYAKNRSRPSRFAQRRNSLKIQDTELADLPSWAWMLLGLALGIAISTFIFWKSNSPPKPEAPKSLSQDTELNYESDKKPKMSSKSKNKKAKILSKAKEEKTKSDLANTKEENHSEEDMATTPETRFDFYTLLASANTDNPETNNTQASAQHAAPYIIQAGSFKTREEAAELKASLALRGLESRIQTVTINPSESWYRVYMGPFDTKADALGAQHRLEDLNDLNSVILKARV